MIEVLIAVVVLGLAFSSLVSSPITSIRTNTHSRQIHAAANLARDKIEELRGLDYQSLTSGADALALNEAEGSGDAGNGQPDEDNYSPSEVDPTAIYTRSWTVSNGPVPDTQTVTVTVTWHGGAQRVELMTVMRDWE